MANGFTDDLHSSHDVVYVGCIDRMLAYMRKMLEEWNIPNDDFVICAVDVSGDDK